MPLSLSLQAAILQRLSAGPSVPGKREFIPVGGGSINETYRVSVAGNDFFCKVNTATKFPQLFRKEQNGLLFIHQQKIFKVPSVIACFEREEKQVLLLEWIREGERTTAFWERFGEQLASLHARTAPEFGLTEDNYMGSVPQSNKLHREWTAFFIHERLQPMVILCRNKSYLTKSHALQFENLYTKLNTIFDPSPPSLVHGDLWSGNFMCNDRQEPVLVDPAIYYGHRSVDLGMTTLFGGFRAPFYEAYNYHSPFAPNYREQWAVCNLYPLLIHLYLFGNSYLPQIQNTLSGFL